MTSSDSSYSYDQDSFNYEELLKKIKTQDICTPHQICYRKINSIEQDKNIQNKFPKEQLAIEQAIKLLKTKFLNVDKSKQKQKKIYTTQHNTTQHNTTQHNTTQHNTTQHNTTQHNTTQHNTTQHNTTQHNTTQHNTLQKQNGF